MTDRTLLAPGLNCWKHLSSPRVAFLVDGEAYFRAFAEALERARHSVMILGWDIDSRIRLRRGAPESELPERLGPFLNALLRRRRHLHIHVLDWDFAMLFALEREPLPIFSFGWKSHRRLHFKLDGRHPVGASHHQKIVVVDDQVAFAGGFDLAACRWDTPEHAPQDPRRVDNGKTYGPFHDVQMLVEGPAAAALGELARLRWQRATGEILPAPPPSGESRWPKGVQADLEDVRVGIARTEPLYNGHSEVREVERLHLDAIADARTLIYIENQYFTSALIGEALARRLREEKGPEIVLVLPRECSGWLEETTMGVLRFRLLQNLRDADRFGRLGIFYPHLQGLSSPLNVHAKVLIVDDRLVRIGSSNLSNRSMGLDTECDLAVEGDREETCAGIARLRYRLLGEHLGAASERVRSAEQETGSMLEAIRILQGGARDLLPLQEGVEAWLDQLVPESSLIDPERPTSMERFVEEFMAVEVRSPNSPRKSRWGGIAAVLVLMLLMAAAWRWTPLREWLDLATLSGAAQAVRQSAWAPLLVVSAFIAGGLILFPVTLLILVTSLTFPPISAFFYALGGCLASAVLTYGIGRFLGRDAVRRLAGFRLNRLSRQLARRGLIAVVVVRFLPIAPFTVVNMVAGASHIRFFDFSVGTLIGMGPGVLAITVFESSLEEAIREPDPMNFLLLAGAILVVAAILWGVRRWLTDKTGNPLRPRGGKNE